MYMVRHVIQFAALLLVLLSVQVVAKESLAATDGLSGNSLTQHNMEDFKKWQEGIPDYERRLYNRVKKINSRTVRLTNIVMIGWTIGLVVLVLGFSTLAIRQQRLARGFSRSVSNEIPLTSVAPAVRDGEPLDSGRDHSSEMKENKQLVRRQAALENMLNEQDQRFDKVESQQKNLKRSLSDLDLSVREYLRHLESMESTRDNLKGIVKTLEHSIDSLGDQLESMRKKTEPETR